MRPEYLSPNGRTRTVTWQDPAISREARQTLAGTEYLRGLLRGDLPAPPIWVLLGFTLIEVEVGRVVFGAEPAEFHYNPMAVVHGGVSATLCDSAVGCAIHSVLPAGTNYTTLELKTNYLRPLTVETGPIRCEGKTIHVGRRTALAEAQIVDAAGKLYVHATTTCIIFSPDASTAL